MASALSLNWGRIVLRGVVAGIVGGVLIDAFLYVATALPQHMSILGIWQFVASSAVGKVAFGSTGYAWLGLTMHFAVSMGWGVGYSYLSETQPAVNARPLVSGLLFGVVVYVVMQMALATVGLLVITSGMQVIIGIIAHTMFFGVPVALVNDWQRPRIA